VVMGGAVHSISLVAACFEFDFMGGSMGAFVGERFFLGACRRQSISGWPLFLWPPRAAPGCKRDYFP